MNTFTIGLVLVLGFVQASNAFLPYVPLPLSLRPSRVKTLVIFGDSTADQDNVFKLTHHTYPIQPYYYKGRFSNGPNWVDQLQVLGLNIKNYAYGSATTDNNLVQGYTKGNTIPVPGMLQQVELYLSENPVAKIDFKSTLYLFYGGGNDLIFNSTLPPPLLVPSLLKGPTLLLSLGAENVVVFDQPPVQNYPYAVLSNNSLLFAGLVTFANQALIVGIKQLHVAYPNASLNIFDLNKVVLQWISKPSSYFTNTVDRCQTVFNATTVEKFCANPDRYVFIDDFHLTTRAQGLLADAFRPFLYDSYEVNNAACYIQQARYLP